MGFFLDETINIIGIRGFGIEVVHFIWWNNPDPSGGIIFIFLTQALLVTLLSV